MLCDVWHTCDHKHRSRSRWGKRAGKRASGRQGVQFQRGRRLATRRRRHRVSRISRRARVHIFLGSSRSARFDSTRTAKSGARRSTLSRRRVGNPTSARAIDRASRWLAVGGCSMCALNSNLDSSSGGVWQHQETRAIDKWVSMIASTNGTMFDWKQFYRPDTFVFRRSRTYSSHQA